MRFLNTVLFVTACSLASAVAELTQRDDASTAEPPSCSLSCLETIVPVYCGSLTNVTCLCTNTELVPPLTTCASRACNVTEALALEKYQAVICGVPNDKARQNEQYILYAVMIPIASLFVVCRAFVRMKLDAGLWLDDYFMIAALLAYWTDAGTGLAITMNGFGQHTFWLSTEEMTNAMKFFYISELFYLVTITCTKLSLILFFRRVFPNKPMRLATLYFGLFIIISNFSMVMALCFQCIPFHGNWTNWMYKVAPVQCINSYAAVFTAAGLSIFHDTVILLMPLPTLWSLNLPWQKRLNLLTMFMVGILVIICSAIRVPTLLKLTGSSDPSYDQSPVAIWTNLEISVGIICACMPALRSLIGWLFPEFKMSLSKGSTPGAYTTSKSRYNTKRRSFIELNEVNGSNATTSSIEDGRRSLHSEINLVPDKGMVHTYIQSREVGAAISELNDRDQGMGITITRDIAHTEERR